MPEKMLINIADRADIIIAGYALTKNEDGIHVLNLEQPTSAAVLSVDGNMIETTMTDTELALVQSYYLRNRELLEEEDA